MVEIFPTEKPDSKPKIDSRHFQLLTVRVMILSELLVETEGEVTPEIEQMMEELSVELKGSTDVYRLVWKRLELESAHFRAESQDYTRKARRIEEALEKLKNRLKVSMAAMKLPKMEGYRYGFRLKKSRPKVVIDEAIFPSVKDRPDLWKETVQFSIQKEAVYQSLVKGEVIGGARLEEVYALEPIELIPEIEGEVQTSNTLKGKKS